MSRLARTSGLVLGLSALALACSTPTAPGSDLPAPGSASTSGGSAAGLRWGPEVPPFNLEAILRGDGFGLVKFRQPNDTDTIVYLDVWVRDLLPTTSYSLQRAVDTNVDGECTGTNWLTLGKGSTPVAIVTDETGTGRAELWRALSGFALGATFDIHFRVIQQGTNPVVVPLQSGCYEFVISQ